MLSPHLLRPITDTQCIHVWPDNEKKYTIHNVYNPPSYITERRTRNATHETSTDPQRCGFPPTTMARHPIEGMLTASNIILPYDEAATPILYPRYTGTMSIPDIRLRRNCQQYTVHCVRRHRKRSQINTLPNHLQNYASSTHTDMEMELQGGTLD